MSIILKTNIENQDQGQEIDLEIDNISPNRNVRKRKGQRKANVRIKRKDIKAVAEVVMVKKIKKESEKKRVEKILTLNRDLKGWGNRLKRIKKRREKEIRSRWVIIQYLES